MTLQDAIEFGHECGLCTPEECVLNIEIHCCNLFPYQDIDRELDELHREYWEKYPNGTLESARDRLNSKLEDIEPNPDEKITREEAQGIVQYIFNNITRYSTIDAAGWFAIEPIQLVQIFNDGMKCIHPDAVLNTKNGWFDEEDN